MVFAVPSVDLFIYYTVKHTTVSKLSRLPFSAYFRAIKRPIPYLELTKTAYSSTYINRG